MFDVDGTLAETEELHRRAFNHAFTAAGLDWYWSRDVYADLLRVTGGKERIRHFIELSDLRPETGDDWIRRLHAEKTRLYAAAIGSITLRPGIRRLIEEARARDIRVAIATTTSPENVDALLQATRLAGLVDVIAAGDEVPRKKPAPDIYLAALRKLATPAASCLAIEDTLNGLMSALGAGIPCIITKSDYGDEGPFPKALAVLASLGDPGVDHGWSQGYRPSSEMVDVAELMTWHARATGEIA